MTHKHWQIGLLSCLLLWHPLVTTAAVPAPSPQPRISVSQKLLTTIERDLRAFLDVAKSIDGAAKSLPQAQRTKVFDLNSRAQRNVRVVQLQHAGSGLLTEQQLERIFVDEYRQFVEGLRNLHRALVLNEDLVDYVDSSLESARRTLAILEAGKT